MATGPGSLWRAQQGEQCCRFPPSTRDLIAPRQFYDDVANKRLQPEETALMIKKFEKRADVHFWRTYKFGKPVPDYESKKALPRVGLVFLPGADLPEVNRLEQTSMGDREPDQRDTYWRVNTAGALLSITSVGKDLSLMTQDLTWQVAERTERRQLNAGPSTYAQGVKPSYSRDAVIMDSDHIKVVQKFAVPGVELGMPQSE